MELRHKDSLGEDAAESVGEPCGWDHYRGV